MYRYKNSIKLEVYTQKERCKETYVSTVASNKKIFYGFSLSCRHMIYMYNCQCETYISAVLLFALFSTDKCRGITYF